MENERKQFDTDEHVLRGYSLLEQSALRSDDPEFVREVDQYLSEARRNVLVSNKDRRSQKLYFHLGNLEKERELEESSNVKLERELEEKIDHYMKKYEISEESPETSLNYLELSVRSRNHLNSMGIGLRELFKYSDEQLSYIPGLGQKSVNEIKEARENELKRILGEFERDKEYETQVVEELTDCTSRLNRELSFNKRKETSYEEVANTEEGFYLLDFTEEQISRIKNSGIDTLKELLMYGSEELHRRKRLPLWFVDKIRSQLNTKELSLRPGEEGR